MSERPLERRTPAQLKAYFSFSLRLTVGLWATPLSWASNFSLICLSSLSQSSKQSLTMTPGSLAVLQPWQKVSQLLVHWPTFHLRRSLKHSKFGMQGNYIIRCLCQCPSAAVVCLEKQCRTELIDLICLVLFGVQLVQVVVVVVVAVVVFLFQSIRGPWMHQSFSNLWQQQALFGIVQASSCFQNALGWIICCRRTLS